MGTIVKAGDVSVLKAGNERYELDSQTKAKGYTGVKAIQFYVTLGQAF
jgi:hypothetical protein